MIYNSIYMYISVYIFGYMYVRVRVCVSARESASKPKTYVGNNFIHFMFHKSEYWLSSLGVAPRWLPGFEPRRVGSPSAVRELALDIRVAGWRCKAPFLSPLEPRRFTSNSCLYKACLAKKFWRCIFICKQSLSYICARGAEWYLAHFTRGYTIYRAYLASLSFLY